METQISQKAVVVNCLWTFVYERPDVCSNVLYSFRLLSDVDILDDQQDSLFYKVSIPNEKFGYCLKEHLAINQN